jgi:hypothetical protein
MTAYSTALIAPIVIQLVIVAVVVRRSYLMSQGVPYSVFRLVAVPVLLLILWAATEAASTLLTRWALPYLIAADTAILVVTAVAFAGVAQQVTHVSADVQGNWNYRVPFAITGLFLAAYVARLVLTVALFPQSLVFGALPSGYPPESQQVVLAVVDGIFSISVGLLVGRSVGIYRKLRSVRTPAK